MGVSEVATADEYEAALAAGFAHDRKLLAEEFIRGREIECSVLEDAAGDLFVSRPGEIVPAESLCLARASVASRSLMQFLALATCLSREGVIRDARPQPLPRALLRAAHSGPDSAEGRGRGPPQNSAIGCAIALPWMGRCEI